MTSHLSRVAAAVLAALTAVAVVDVSQSLAQAVAPSVDDVISTTCGAGTRTECAQKPIESCSWDFSISFSRTGGGISLKVMDCKVTGHVPIYKDNDRDSYVFSGSCDLLNPFLGMPAGSGCS